MAPIAVRCWTVPAERTYVTDTVGTVGGWTTTIGTAMDYIPLGNSGMKVSRYILGTLTFSGTNGFEPLGSVDVAGARRMIDMALDAGVNAIDTADLYSKGEAETVVGEALRGPT